nr:hypothetical protein [Tanacetum cinerariifolium]
EVDTVKEKIDAKAELVKELEAKLEAMRSGPSLKELKEKEKSVLEKDVKKFNDLIKQLRDHEARAEKQIEEKEKQLAVKLEERSMIPVETGELKKKVEEQGFNMRDAERMKRELQATSEDADLRDVDSLSVSKMEIETVSGAVLPTKCCNLKDTSPITEPASGTRAN